MPDPVYLDDSGNPTGGIVPDVQGNLMQRPAQAAAGAPSLWRQANTGLLGADTISRAMFGANQQQLQQMRDLPPTQSGAESPGQAAWRTFITGVGHDTSQLASSFTSPVQLGLMGLGAIAKAPGAIGTIAKTALTGAGLGYGAAGAVQTVKGIGEGVTTPQGAQDVLLGGSQVAGSAGAVQQTGRAVASIPAKIAPAAFATGEPALVNALKPALKDVPIVRNAIRTAMPDLQQAQPQNFEQLRDFAKQTRVAVAQQTNARIAQTGQQLDANAIRAAIKGEVTPLMQVESSPTTAQQTVQTSAVNAAGQPITQTQPVATTKLPPKAQAFVDYANRVADNIQNGQMGLPEAEKLVQNINAEAREFQRMTPDAQRQALAEGDPISAKLAFKNELQRQIEQSVSNYPDLKAKYGAFRELENQSQRRIDQMQTAQPVGAGTRRAVEGAAGLGGAMLGAHQGPIESGVYAYAAYKATQAASDLYLQHLANPERMLQRGMIPHQQRNPIDLSGVPVQSLASQQQQ